MAFDAQKGELVENATATETKSLITTYLAALKLATKNTSQ